MKFLKDRKIILLIIILLIFTVGYFVAVNKISYAFINNFDYNSSQEKLKETIEKGAKYYASNNEELFSTENTIYIKVQDLIDNGILKTNEGSIINIETNERLNDKIIKIKKDGKDFKIEINN